MKSRTKRVIYLLAFLLLVIALLGAGTIFLQVNFSDTLRNSYGITAEGDHYVETGWGRIVTPGRWIHLSGHTDLKGTHGHFITQRGIIYYGYCNFDDWPMEENEDGLLIAYSLGDDYQIKIVDGAYSYYVATSQNGRSVGVQVPAQHDMVRPLTLYPSRALAHYVDQVEEVLSLSDFNR